MTLRVWPLVLPGREVDGLSGGCGAWLAPARSGLPPGTSSVTARAVEWCGIGPNSPSGSAALPVKLGCGGAGDFHAPRVTR